MRVAARIEETSTSITHVVFIDDEEIPLDPGTWMKLAVQHCHELRDRTILGQQDTAVCEEMEAGE